MGACCSTMCLPHSGKCSCSRRSECSSSSKKTLGRNLSAAFSVVAGSDDDDASARGLEKLNVNTATEEELMTLPCVSRATARNIVEYRRQIGGFRRVEDMVLVTGVGAARLDQMRHEVCVNGGCGSVKASQAGTPNGSSTQLDAVLPPISSARRPASAQPRVDINTANVFQLLRVKGLGLTTAQHIVEYRTKHGPFEASESLLKVKGVSAAVFGSIRHQIMVETSERGSGASDHLSNSDSGVALPSNAMAAANSAGIADMRNGRSKKGSSASLVSVEGVASVASPVPLSFIAGVPGEGWQRPRVSPPMPRIKDGHATLRIATWNVQQCGEDKIANPGVLEVICMTVLENGLDIVAFQELGSTSVMDRVCAELNSPTLPSNVAWNHRRGYWASVTSKAVGRMFQSAEYNGFLYDTQHGIVLKESGLLGQEDVSTSATVHSRGDHVALVRQPFFAIFEADKLSWMLISVHLKSVGMGSVTAATEATRQEVAAVGTLLQSAGNDSAGSRVDGTVILGDFNLPPDQSEFDAFRTNRYANLIPANVFTNISTKNHLGSHCYDNIWASRPMQQVYSGANGVVRTGLSSPWIPNGWSWGGIVSDHCPVWAEFYVGRQLDFASLRTALKELAP